MVAWFILTIAAVFQLIVMLNLLIAVICAAYNRVSKDVICHEYRERCSLMAEIEGMMYWKRLSGASKYVHVALYKDKYQEENLKEEDAPY